MFLVMPHAALYGKYFDSGEELPRQNRDGVRHRDQGEYPSAVPRRALGNLVVRAAEAPRDGSPGV